MSLRTYDHGIESLTKLPLTMKPWVRKSEWLTLPSVTETDQKFSALYAVYPDSSFVALMAAGDYTVNWGDGTVENFTANTIAYHTYNYDTFDVSNSTLTSEGYKQAIITLTPQAGQQLTLLDLHLKHNTLSLQSYSTGYLDIELASPYLTDLFIGVRKNSLVQGDIKFCSLERINIVKTNCKRTQSLFYSMSALSRIENFNFASDVEVVEKTATLSGNYVQSVGHLLNNGDSVFFTEVTTSDLVNTGGFVNAAGYFVINAEADGYQISDIPGGTAVAFTNGTCKYKSGPTFKQTFFGCHSLQSLPMMDTANVINFSSAFYNCSNLEYIPPLNTTNVLTIGSAFQNCYSLRNNPMSTFQNVFISSYAYYRTTSLNETVVVDGGKLTNASYMFSYSSVPRVEFRGTNKLTNAMRTFQNATSLRYFKSDQTTYIDNAVFMFANCPTLAECYFYSGIKIHQLASVFNGCRSLIEAPLFDTSSTSSINSMFNGCASLNKVPLYNFGSVTTASGAFNGCVALKKVPLFDLSAVTAVGYMFCNCSGLESIPAFNLSSVTAGNFNSMIEGCPSLASFKATDVKFSISFTGCKLSATALNEIYTNLDTVSGETITVTNNHGTASDNPAIATAKGWTVTG